MHAVKLQIRLDKVSTRANASPLFRSNLILFIAYYDSDMDGLSLGLSLLATGDLCIKFVNHSRCSLSTSLIVIEDMESFSTSDASRIRKQTEKSWNRRSV